jgi:hypothetical protein
MRSLLILATLALVCFVDKNSAAAVRRDDGFSKDDADVFNDIGKTTDKLLNSDATPDNTFGDTVFTAPNDATH